jgi:hypothetical protein
MKDFSYIHGERIYTFKQNIFDTLKTVIEERDDWRDFATWIMEHEKDIGTQRMFDDLNKKYPNYEK